jgi:hypothetical protein
VVAFHPRKPCFGIFTLYLEVKMKVWAGSAEKQPLPGAFSMERYFVFKKNRAFAESTCERLWKQRFDRLFCRKCR